MDNQDIRTLRVLEEVGKEEQPSQRELAGRLGISLGLVNSFIKRLARKGYFKITTLPANRVGYILTPKGAAEKTRLTYQYIQYSFLYYRQTKDKLHGIFSRLEQEGVKRLVFWGSGELAEIAYVALQESSMQLVAVIDSATEGKKFMGMEVRGAGFIDDCDFDRIVVTASNDVDTVMEEISNNNKLAEPVVLIE